MGAVIIAAIITGVSAILAALITANFTRLKRIHKSTRNNYKKQEERPSLQESFSTESETLAPYLWIPVNHSKSEIDFEKIVKNQQELKIFHFLKSHYNKYIGRSLKLSLVKEVSGTLNYRVISKGNDKKPILLRIHNRISSEVALNTLQAVQHHIYESEVFSDSSFDECLIAQLSDDGNKYEQFEGRFVEIYPFADNVKHYSGTNLKQVENLALKYGLVQKRLKTLGTNLDLKSIANVRPNIYWFGEEEPNFNLFELICDNNDMAIKKAKPDIMTVIFDEHKNLLVQTWEEVRPLLENVKMQKEPLLHDFHPHNTFFQDDKCVLIYDYEAVSTYWSPTEALAFTIHRFTREYIRHLKYRNYQSFEVEIPKVIDIFLKSYEKAGMSIPNGFTQNLSLEIKSTNMAKLIAIMGFYYELLTDPANRDKNIWYHELIKFITFLKEAKLYHI